jgi:uncharacterized membrane protein YccC
MTMRTSRRRTLVSLTLLLAGLSVAPAAPEKEPARPSPLAEARYRAAVEQYEITWSYYQQARIDSYQVYLWSRLVLDARREMNEAPADRIIALEDHLARMKKLEELVRRIRRLGFGRSYDVGATEYYRLEAEHWLARASEKKR